MIIGALITILVSLLVGGAGGMFLIPDIEKRIKKLIGDRHRSATMLTVLKNAKLAGKRFQKKQQAYGKLLTLLMAERDTSRQELEGLFEAALQGIRNYQSTLIESRIAILEQLTPEEFSLITDPDIKATVKREQEVATQQKKTLARLDTAIEGIASFVRSGVASPSRRDKALAALSDYRLANYTLAGKLTDWNYRDSAILQDYTASKTQYRDVAEDVNSIRCQIYQSFVELYLQLASASTDGEWKAASKALNKLVSDASTVHQ